MSELKSVKQSDVIWGHWFTKYYLKSAADREIRHQKYKRCLAMAEWCDAEADVADADGDYEDMRWYQKWRKRWLELADKVKEAK